MKHISVLKEEAIKLLNVKPSGVYLDLTLGRAGHASEILKRLTTGKLIAFDLDETALKESKVILDKISNRYQLIHSNYRYFDHYVKEKVDGIILDLGVSSPQFDDASRGFSYQVNAPLDMRMDLTNPITAKKLVNTLSLQELTKIFREYGEEKDAYQIAKNIVKAREEKEIITTFDLVNIIKQSKSNKTLAKKGHPAKQVFQALRIKVNDELNSLTEALFKCLKALKKDGRLVVISFHSLEDRIVKQAFSQVTSFQGNRNDDYQLPSQKQFEYVLLNKKVIVPSNKELTNNPRSKSAKLRGIKKI
ncbi:MAG: 16S rRNA (cytosine(1402)-N(4))-methyltransferase RsmH [Bacilli bacterium]|nr:16S rRNA (cytosine(1402)-N(4))-methyltransferase RsmH [Bacilli bacterium]